MSPKSDSKKRRASEGASYEVAAAEERSYEDLSKEIVALKRELKEAKAEIESLKEKLGNEDSDSDGSDDEDCDAEPNDPWMINFKQLREYRTIHGDCKISKTGGPNPKLGRWVDNQRTAFRNVKAAKTSGPKITPERIALLDGIGFFWGSKFPAPVSWDERFHELKEYKKTFGTCSVPLSPTDPTPLAKWVAAQRSEYKRLKKGRDSLLTTDQVGQLNELNFKWKGPRIV